MIRRRISGKRGCFLIVSVEGIFTPTMKCFYVAMKKVSYFKSKMVTTKIEI
jgi:hypothetical protein